MSADLVPSTPRAPGAQLTITSARTALDQIRKTMLEPFEHLQRLKRLGWWRFATAEEITAWDIVQGDRERYAASIHARLEAIPPEEELITLKAALEDALEPPTTQAGARDRQVLISTMVSAFRKVDAGEPAVYLATLQHYAEADGFSCPVVAAACDQIRRNSRFPPSVSELLDACNEQAARLRSGVLAVDRIIKVRKKAETVIPEADRIAEERREAQAEYLQRVAAKQRAGQTEGRDMEIRF